MYYVFDLALNFFFGLHLMYVFIFLVKFSHYSIF